MHKKDIINKAGKIIIKIGSSTVVDQHGKIDEEFLRNLSTQCKKLMDNGKKIIIVTSGARMTGVGSINKWSRKEDMNYKQALCAIGQVALMGEYRRIFLEKDLHIAQILLTKDDMIDDNRNLHIRNTLFTLIDEDVIPVINENDTVCVEEIKIGDNDLLAARVGTLWAADLVIILTDIEGIYDKNPKEHKDAKLLEYIEDLDTLEVEEGEEGSFGTGGVTTKIKAAKLLSQYGCSLAITRGKPSPTAVLDIFDDKVRYTLIRGNVE
ncbi:MAG TPA: glutamate 5-kinase [Clostridiaceae bacterium]|nr:glutamate 5-kinase [Clostridiaceae bacterium]